MVVDKFSVTKVNGRVIIRASVTKVNVRVIIRAQLTSSHPRHWCQMVQHLIAVDIG
jgi:hypothetical protein